MMKRSKLYFAGIAFAAALAVGSLPTSSQYVNSFTSLLRSFLTGTQNLYVATTGSDTNNNCATAATPCATLQYAVNQYLANYDGRGFVTNINVGNGIYAGFVCSGVPVGTAFGGSTPAYLSIVGTNGSGNVTISETGAAGAAAGAVGANNGCYIALQGVKVQSTNNNGLFAGSNGTVQVNTDYVAGPAGNLAGKFHADYGAGIIKIAASYTSIGNAGAEAQGSLAGHIIYPESPITVTLSGTPAYSRGFVDAIDLSLIYINSNFVTFSGAATGKRFSLASGAVLETIGGAAVTYIPGNAAGTTINGAYYSPGTFNIGTSPIAASNVVQTTSSNPTGTTNLIGNGVMMGGGGTITPQTTGNIQITFSGACANSVVADGGGVSIYVGTGTAPVNGAALTGSPIGSQIVFTESTAAAFLPCSGSAIATAQTLGTALWFQLALVARTGGTASLVQVSMTASEQ